MSIIAAQSILGPPCTVTKENYRGWRAIRLANGILELFVVPEIGGRVIQLRVGDLDLFYVNHRHEGRVYRPEENDLDSGWKNYGGSKVWPAPQGWASDAEWPGPPDPVLDGGVYSCEIVQERGETAAVRLESSPDQYTGLTFVRVIRIFRDAARVEVRHTMRNTSARRVRWAVWQVTQQAATSDVSIFVPARTYRQLFGDRAYGEISFSANGLCRLRYRDQVAKFAMKPERGWLATLDTGRGFSLVETFPLFRASAYPDDSPVEFWVNGRGSVTIHNDKTHMEHDPNGCDPYIETEVLSPLIELEPGEEYGFPTCWCGVSIQTDSVDAVTYCAAIGRRLMAERQGKEVWVTGSFGLWQVGLLEAVSVLANGKVRDVHILGPVTPLAACHVCCSLPWEQRLSRVSLRLRDKHGNLLGTVDEAVISQECCPKGAA
jgi:hypothetical protein